MPVRSGLRAAIVAVTVMLAFGSAAGVDAAPDPDSASLQTGAAPGYDISWPQCGAAYPTDPAFGIVGVNRGIVFRANPCLASELTWAGGANAGLYANTGNPGPALSTHWPIGQTSPRLCSATDTDSADCAYDYGYNAAADSYVDAISAFTALSLTASPAGSAWWLDVETSNSWRSDVSLNVAALSGAVDYLGSVVHVASLGFYSTGYQWGVITGGTSAFDAYPSWVAGAGDAAGASANCAGSGFTGGGVELAQYQSGGFDANVRCSAPKQVLSSIVVSPASTSVVARTSVRFGATARDQSGQPMTKQPAIIWFVSGGGTIDASGRFTAGSTAGGPFTVIASAVGVTGTARVSVTPAPDFSLSVSPAVISIGRGGTGTYTITISPIGGFAGSVTLTANGAPAGSTVTFGTNPTPGSSTLIVKTSKTVPKGTYTLTVSGTSGSLVHTTTATLKVAK